LKEGVQRLRLAAQATGVGIWEWNVLTNQIHWDEQMFRIYGLAPTANGLVPYTAWSGAVVPEDLRQQEAALQDTVRRCGQGRREFRIRRAEDGEIRELEAVETVRTNAGGQAEWVVGTNLDVTDRKRAEAVVREREVFIHDVINSLSAHTAVLDEHGVILSVNEAWKRFAAENSGDENTVGPGINYLEVCRRSLDSPAGKFSREAGQGIQSVINGTCSSFRLEYSCHSPTVERWFLMSVQPLRGARKGVVITHENITETKRAEQELTDKNLELATALAKVKQLSGLLPICAGCKKIRDDYGIWKPVEIFVGEHSEANFTHGFCPDCSRKYFPPEI
jgi:PAS domain S-box-containing protein